MLRVIAIDDEPLALRQLTAYIQRVPFLELVAQCQSAVEAQTTLRAETIDAIFCDINMPDLNGMDFVRDLERNGQQKPLVIFTTAYSEYAVDGFRVDAVDYLLKPFSFNEFQQAAERLEQRYNLLHPHTQKVQDEEILFVRANRATHAVPLSSIRYIQGMSEYIRIFTSDRPHPITTLMTMKSLEERLPSDRFLRIHRSYFVALSELRQVKRASVVLRDETELPVGDNSRAALEAWLKSHDRSIQPSV